MDIFQTFFLAVIQGITEFLPISSSGHLILIHKIFNDNSKNNVLFDLALHVGTTFAIILYFKNLILELLQDLPKYFRNFFDKKLGESKNDYFIHHLIISNLACFVLVFPLKNFARDGVRSSFFVALNLIIFGVLLDLADRWQKKKENKKIPEDLMPLKGAHFKAIIMGLSQALAIFPGVSRSGILLTLGRSLGLSRKEAAYYAFVLGIPIILAGVVSEIPHYIEAIKLDTSFMVGNLCFGVFISFLTGIATIHFFLKLIPKIGLFPFALYRVFLGGSLLFMIARSSPL